MGETMETLSTVTNEALVGVALTPAIGHQQERQFVGRSLGRMQPAWG
jgi:hypothetical protein